MRKTRPIPSSDTFWKLFSTGIKFEVKSIFNVAVAELSGHIPCFGQLSKTFGDLQEKKQDGFRTFIFVQMLIEKQVYIHLSEAGSCTEVPFNCNSSSCLFRWVQVRYADWRIHRETHCRDTIARKGVQSDCFWSQHHVRRFLTSILCNVLWISLALFIVKSALHVHCTDRLSRVAINWLGNIRISFVKLISVGQSTVYGTELKVVHHAENEAPEM